MGEWIPGLLIASIRTNAQRLDALKDAFSPSPSQDLPDVMRIIMIVIGVCLAILVIDRIARRLRRPATPKRVEYFELASAALRLGWQQQRDLRWIATRAGIDEPAALLLSPGTLQAAVGRALAREDDPGLRERMTALRKWLFEE